jgi:hypothetical protein
VKKILISDNLVAQLVSMGIIVDNYLYISWKMSYLMGGQNAYMWHDNMCQSRTLITK